MLTPQEVSERAFQKASFGGYNMVQVDEFLDVLTGDSDKNTLGSLVEDLDALQPQEALVRQELEKLMHQMLDSLNERQRKILCLHFGLEDGVEHSLEEIGKSMGISKERARQIERQAMDKLQAMGESMGLEDFLE